VGLNQFLIPRHRDKGTENAMDFNQDGPIVIVRKVLDTPKQQRVPICHGAPRAEKGFKILLSAALNPKPQAALSSPCSLSLGEQSEQMPTATPI